MLNLQAWDMAVIQDCLAVLAECERQGISDVSLARQEVTAYLRSETDKRLAEPSMETSVPEYVGTCPDCGSTTLRRTSVEGEIILTCMDCRWSGYIGVQP
jgi:ribosomal protein L37AE/L43A